MYARRFADGPRFRPASLGAALAINGGVIAALLLVSPEVIRTVPIPPLITFTPAPEPSPPPPDPQPTSDIKQPRPVPTALPDPGKTTDELKEAVDTSTGVFPTGDGGDIAGTGDIGTKVYPPPLPALIGATFDPRYAADIEPPYPDAARDAGTEGVVKLRLTIGINGRVTRAEPLGGDPILTRAAVRHVLARWRFKPATRGGVPEESSRVMTVRFRLDA